MITILLVLQVFVTLALIGIVLIQRSEGGGLGLGTSQGMGGFMTGRGTANLLTRTTAVLAAAFMGISLTLALLYKHSTEGSGSAAILNTPPAASTKAPAKSKPAGAGLPAVPGGSGTSSGSASGGNVEVNLPQRPADAGMGAPASNSPPAGGQGSGGGTQGGGTSGGSASNALPIPGMSSGAPSSGTASSGTASSGTASTSPSSK